MIAITNLSKKYDKKIIFNGVSCSLADRRVYALVGINGIGKSTLLNAITQSFSIDGGKIEIDGISSDLFQSKSHFFYVPDNKEMFLNLTGREYLQFVIKLYQQESRKTSHIIEELSCTFKLEQSLDDYIANYSLGMKQRLALGIALLSDPKLLILDEPTNGLDPAGVFDLRNQLKTLAKEKHVCILVSSHQLGELEKISDRYICINKGKIVENPKQMKNDSCYHITMKKTEQVEKLMEQAASVYSYTYQENGYVILVKENHKIQDVLHLFQKEQIEYEDITKKVIDIETMYSELYEA